MPPTTKSTQFRSTPSRLIELTMSDISRAPSTDPNTVPSPPFRLAPPMITAEITRSSSPLPAVVDAEPSRAVITMPASAARKPTRAKLITVIRFTSIPERRAARSFPPM